MQWTIELLVHIVYSGLMKDLHQEIAAQPMLHQAFREAFSEVFPEGAQTVRCPHGTLDPNCAECTAIADAEDPEGAEAEKRWKVLARQIRELNAC